MSAVCRDSCDAVLDQCIYRFFQSCDGLKKVAEYYRLKSVQLQLSGFCCHSNGSIMSHNVKSNLAYYLRDYRVYLSWHDGGTVLFGRKVNLTKTGFRTGRHQPQVVAHLGKIHRTGFYHTGHCNETVQVFCCVKKIFCLSQRIACEVCQIRHDPIKIRIRNIDRCSYCCSAKVYCIHFFVSFFNTSAVSGYHGCVAVEHLSKSYRYCILKLCTSHCDHIVEFLCLSGKLFLKSCQRFFQRGQQIQYCKFTGCRNYIVCGLCHVYMIVRVNQAVASFWTAKKLSCSVGDHLIHVHVCTGSGSALDCIYDKFFCPSAVDHLITGFDNGICFFLWKKSCVIICDSCRFFYLCQVFDKYRMKFCSCDRKVLFCS